MRNDMKLALACLASGWLGVASATATAEEAAKLGKSLTPWGAEAGANSAGTIPAYTGTKIIVPASYDPKKPGVRPDPFASEKPLYSVTAANIGQYGAIVSDGMKEMLKKYPTTFRLDVYPTHRTQRYPKFFIDNSLKNATGCKASADGLSIEGCLPGMPFPIPKTGVEEMWNHVMRYNSPNYEGVFASYTVDTSGGVTLQGESPAWFRHPIFLPDHWDKVIAPDDRVRQMLVDTTAPPRKVGEKVLLEDFFDTKENPSHAWQYLPGQRRVKLAPDLLYDTPNTQSAGSATMDEMYVLSGPIDRYDYKLVGKREMLIVVNDYRFLDAQAMPPAKKYMTGHVNPDALRFELRRVWEVEATLKPGLRHIYKTRKFYFDEDSPGTGLGDNFDASGKIHRTVIDNYTPWYETDDQGQAEPVLVFDLLSGIYVSNADTAYSGGLAPSKTPQPASRYSPDSLAGSGIR